MSDHFQDRRLYIQGFFVLIALVLIVRIAQIQLFTSEYKTQAQATARGKITMYPSRGLIYDRNGNLLVNNEAMYDIKVTYNEVKDIDTAKLCALLGIDRATFIANIEKDWSDYRFRKYKPFTFMSKVPADVYTRFQESLYEFPGFYVELRNVRSYPYSVGAHVLGYLAEVNQVQIDRQPHIYERGDFIGASGLEYYYEERLRGEKGKEYVMKDKFGRIQGRWAGGNKDSAAVSGQDLVSTLDIELQQYAERLLQNKRGAIVAIEPASGEILAMASAPSYDPNLLTINRNRGAAFNMLNANDTLRPLYNRALMAEYPPGSIFKTVMSLIAMQEGVWTVDRGVGCPGGYFYKGLRVGCHGHPYPGNVQMALQHSCNAYYCTVFREVVEKYGFENAGRGLDSLVQRLYAFGLGKPLGTDIPNEENGNIPTSSFYDKLYPKDRGGWRSPTVISMSIGQGEVQMTCLQMANLAAIIANKGYYYPPHLARGFGYEAVKKADKKLFARRWAGVDSVHYQPVIDGMEGAVLGGTARVAQIEGIQVCGKTGTSQNPHGKDHSVFFAFAPKDKPKIAIAVFVENAGYGATYAAPIASLMIERYLNGSISEKRTWLEDRILKADILYQW